MVEAAPGAGARGRILRRTVAAGALIALAACGQEPPADSLVLVTLDTTRADRIGAYGHPGAATPTLDRLAAEGVLYERAYSPAPETLPAHASLLTGLYPPSHGVRLNLDFRLAPGALTLAELLTERGRRSAAVVSSRVLHSRYGLDQGFGRYEAPPREEGPREWSAGEVNRRALAAAEGFGGRPYFLWVHYYEPHAPYEPAEPFAVPEGASAAERYQREISLTDHRLGELLRGLEERGLSERAVVLVVGDHGESLGEHGETYHTLFIYEATQRVPLIAWGAGVPAGRRVEETVSALDIFASAARLLGMEPPAGTSSRPLPGLGLETGRNGAGRRRAVFSESMAAPLRFGWAGLQGVRVRDWLYIRAPREELYDLAADPGERINLAPVEPELLAGMRATLSRTLAEMPEVAWGGEAGREVGKEERERLEALGYLAADRPDPLDEPLEGEDPKELVEVAEAYQLARLARRLDRPATAEELLRFVVLADPANFGGWKELGEVLLDLDRPAGAARALRRAVELRPASWRALLGLARAEHRLGEWPAAERHLLTALRTVPFPADVWRELGRLRLAVGDPEGAAGAWRRVLELEPGDEAAARALARLAPTGTPTGPPTGTPGAGPGSPP